MDIFPQEEPQVGPVGGIPKEGIVIRRQLICVITSEDLSVGQDVKWEDSRFNDPNLVKA